MLVANDNERTEIEAASAFDDFGRAIDEDHLLNQFLPGLRVVSWFWLRPATPTATRSARRSGFAASWSGFAAPYSGFDAPCFGWFRNRVCFHYTLELETCFTRCVGQGFHLAMISRAAAVKNYLFDPLG